MSLGNLKLRDMKRSAREQREEVASEYEPPSYPYGLRLSLDDESISKLGIELPSVGDTFTVAALATVQSVSEYESEDDRTRCIELQITKLGLNGSE